MIDIQWDQKFEIGHPRIDNEHRVFVDLIRAVSQAAEQGAPRDKAQRLLLEVRKYAEFHFLSEENLMLDVGFEDYATHHDEHVWLLRRLEDEMHRFDDNALPLSALADFMFEWFALHTTRDDRKLATAIARQQAMQEQ